MSSWKDDELCSIGMSETWCKFFQIPIFISNDENEYNSQGMLLYTTLLC